MFYEIYEASKHKNYVLISNLIDNIDFNLEKIKFEKNTTKDKDLENLINYFKTDFILKVKIKKESNKNLDDKNNINEENNKNEEIKENNVENDKKDEGNKESIDKPGEEKMIAEEPREEEKKEGEIQNNIKEKKEEEKKDEDKKEDEKKEGENKEEEKKDEENKQEEDGHVKSMKEITAMLSNRIISQGGFKQGSSSISSSNKNNDIIHEPKGTPEAVVNIIQNQKIIKKTKKKPKKINFDS